MWWRMLLKGENERRGQTLFPILLFLIQRFKSFRNRIAIEEICHIERLKNETWTWSCKKRERRERKRERGGEKKEKSEERKKKEEMRISLFLLHESERESHWFYLHFISNLVSNFSNILFDKFFSKCLFYICIAMQQQQIEIECDNHLLNPDWCYRV